MVKNPPANARAAGDVCLIPGSKDPLEKEMATYSRVMKSHGQRSLAGYGPWGHKESDTTEHICNANATSRDTTPNTILS